jgi:hypothetical protein
MSIRYPALLIMLAFVIRDALGQRVDTTIVQARNPLNAGVGTLVEEQVLESSAGSSAYDFTSPVVRARRDGGVFVVDRVQRPASSSVRVYDTRARFVRTIGRNGRGPGEYVFWVGDVRELPDGRLLMSDAHGVLVYSATGAPLARWPAKHHIGNVGSAILVDSSGTAYVYGSTPRLPTDRHIDWLPFLYRFRADGRLLDTVAAPQATFPKPPKAGLVQLPFARTDMVAWSPLGYFVSANTGLYSINLNFSSDLKIPRSSTTAQVRSIRLSVPTVPVVGAERADWRQSIVMFNRSSPAARLWTWDGPDIPTTKPPIRALQVDGGGRIWVRVSQPANLNDIVKIATRPTSPDSGFRLDAVARWVEPIVWDIFEPSGQYVGRVRMPDGLGHDGFGPDFDAIGNTVWAVHWEQDVPTVRRYVLKW